jgi:hypothetical protein
LAKCCSELRINRRRKMVHLKRIVYKFETIKWQQFFLNSELNQKQINKVALVNSIYITSPRCMCIWGLDLSSQFWLKVGMQRGSFEIGS